MRFLDAEMDLQEMEHFRKELEANPEMRAQLDFEQSLRDDFALHHLEPIPETAIVSQPRNTNNSSGKFLFLRKWISVAAITIVLIVLANYLRKGIISDVVTGRTEADTSTSVKIQPVPGVVITGKDSSAVDLELIFREYFRKDELPEEYPMFLADALEDYGRGNYNTIQKLDLNQIPQTRSGEEKVAKQQTLLIGQYFKGIAYLQTNETRQAITNLRTVSGQETNKKLQVRAKWYLMLAYIRQGDKEKAGELCRAIIAYGNKDARVNDARKIAERLGK